MDPLTWCFQVVTSPHVREWVKQELIHLFVYEARLEELEGVVEVLKKEQETVIKGVNEAENRYGKVRASKVEKWIKGVDNIISEYMQFNQDKCLHELAVLNFLTNGYLPKPGIRYCRSKKAYDIIKNVTGKLKTAKFDTYSEWSGPPSDDAFLHNDSYEKFSSRDEIVKNLKAALENPSVRMIGLHGLKGVGKTTLVKEVAKEVKANERFVVTMVNLEANPADLRIIQGEIAGRLGITLVEESETARAAQLENHFKKKSTIVILDHLCVVLDLKKLGIPSVNDDLKIVEKGKSPVQHSMVEIEETLVDCYKVCKVLLISESKQLLLSQMGGKEKNIFTMDVLQDKEAEIFFRKTVRIGDQDSELDILAAQIANKCNGLPSSIVESANGLVNQKNHSAWTNTLENLERQISTGVPEFSTKLSYELLKDEELENTFLLCAFMGPDVLITDLVKHCIGMNYLQGIHKVRDARVKVHELVRKLKLFGLLSDNHSIDHITMQVIVRSAALSIASDIEEKHIFTMTKKPFYEWPDEDKLEKCAVISLRHCNIVDGSLKRINCPRLKFFHIDNNDPRLEIPTNFFEGMKELRVLIMTGIHLSPSDSSIASLTNLRMLCLERCILDKDLSFIGNLKKLRILSFSGSDIEKLPDELKQVKKLQVFDISNCFKLREIPSNVISSLTDLEELHMRNTFIQWKPIGQTYPSGIASLSEFRHLIENQLKTLDIQIPTVSCLPKDLLFDKLDSYKIVVGDVNAYFETDFKMLENYESSRFLAIQLRNGFDIHSQKGIKVLFEKVENLFLEELNGVHDMFSNLNLKGFPFLKHLLIVNNSEIQSLINPKDRQRTEKAFLKLESLHFYNLKNMDEICSCKLLAPSFSKLKVIKINLCHKLNKVFLFSMVSLLTVLETIEVSECNALKEIVAMESQINPTGIKLLKFPELRSLTLLSLPGLIGFNSIPSTGRKATELFHEKVVVPKLERMVLSSIQIGKIWCDQPSQCFRNLIHLDVNGCWNLEYLISFSMAENLVNLESLIVSDCMQMTTIFPQGQASHAKIKDCIFPNLKNIKLSRMDSLMEIWNSELPSNSFGKLDTLIIEECDKLHKVFPCYMGGIFKILCTLRITNCKSMTAIFDLDDKKGDARDVANLRDVHLETLPELEHVWKWNKDQDGILKLNYLQKMWVSDCDGLENIFPLSEAKNLSELEYLVVCDCFNLREIVANGEGANTAGTSSSYISFMFPKLSTIKFSKLPKLRRFYRGEYELSCPALNNLSVELCDKLEPFRKETADEKPVLFPEEVINQLKSMQIDSWNAESCSSYTGKGNYRRDKLQELHLCRLKNTDILYSFLYSNPDLKTVSLIDCFFEKIWPPRKPLELQNAGVVPNLKNLSLIDLPNLKMIGFEKGTFIQRIELLILKNCACLVNIMPSSVSLTYLTYLEVVNCNGLKTLMSLSSAKSMSHLNTMKVFKCESLQEIVENQDENGDIVFGQLKALELVSLQSLKSFCSSKTCVFVFPSLEKLVVSACPKMENFSEVKITPLLQKIYVLPENEKRWCWNYNLNGTIKYMFKEKNFFEGMEEINVAEHPELQECWYGDPFLQNNWFYSLKTLKLKNCKIQSCAIPSNILPCLKSLKELEVRECHSAKTIFDIDDAQIMRTVSQLKKMTLEKLPNLTHVWKENQQVGHTCQNLQQVIVRECKNLKTLFPVALAENLMKLEELTIESCDEMLGIVGKETAGKEVTQKFVYPYLTSLRLISLPKLTFFYPGSFTLECPAFNTLTVHYCFKLKLFQSAPLEDDTEGSSTSIYKQPFFLDVRAISNLEELALDWKDTSALTFRQFTENLTYLDTLALNFYGLNSENKQPSFLFEILEKTLNVMQLDIHHCSRPEILLGQNSNIGEEVVLGHLEMLLLNNITNLQFVGSEGSSLLNTIIERLRRLIVSSCPDLTILVHPASAVSFCCLKELDITECHGLDYLFTSSVANKLMYLVEIKVKNCNTMTRIVERVDTSEEVKLEQLGRIVLNSLSSLECFYSGSETLQLPTLAQVDILDCPNMEVFSQGSIDAESIKKIQIDDDLVIYDDLNVSVKMMFLQQVDQDHLVIGDSLLFQKIWLESIPVLDSFICNLKSLIMEGCGFLTNTTIPSHLLPSLCNLEELQVRNCNSVKAIFNQTKMNSMGPSSDCLSLRLKKLVLEQLPILEHVWNEDPQGSLSLPYLEEVLVDGCESIKSLFPASVKMDRLQILHVKKCDKLVEIVAKENIAAEKANDKRFPSVTSLKLWNLPNLRWIYPGMGILEWPKLKKLDILHCQILNFFLTEFQTCVSLEKVTPNLKLLSLGTEEVAMIVQGTLFLDLLELQFLRLQCFIDGSDIFAFLLSSRLPPSIENLVVVHSSFKEIFPPTSTVTQYHRMSALLSQLKGLKLQNLPQLKSIGLEHSWIKRFVGKLETISVKECGCMTNLIPSIRRVSFSNLTKLKVKDCFGLEYLFSSSTANTLHVLKELHVTNCESIQNIVANENKNEDGNSITFGKLELLDLISLPKLESFYSGSSTLNFPSLDIMWIKECHNMKAFCSGEVVIKEKLWVRIDGDGIEGDLNDVIEQRFEEKESRI